MEVRRISPDQGFIQKIVELEETVKNLQTRSFGTYEDTDDSGVSTVIGVLPDGSIGIDQFVNDTTPPAQPSTPVVTVANSLLAVSWNGKDVLGGDPPKDYKKTLVEKSTDGTTGWVVVDELRGNSLVYVSGLSFTAPTFFRLVSIDTNNNRSVPSATVSGTPQQLVESPDIQAELQIIRTDVVAAQNTANAKARVSYQDEPPAGTAHSANDIWFDTNDGNKPYRWVVGTGWVVAQDATIAAAQSKADTAFSVANGKNTIFYQTTMPAGGTYIAGDTWFDTDDGNKVYVHNGTTFVSAQDAAIGTAQSTANNALTTANSKIKTYFQSTSPGLSGNTNGDIWFDTGNGNKPYVWTGSAWTVAQDAAIAAAQTSANGKNTIFYQTTAPATTGRVTGDTWFDTDDGNKIYVWNGTAWTLSQDAAIAAAQTTANSKTKTFIQSTAPTATTVGDIWIDTANGNVIKTWEGTVWVNRADAAIATAQNTANTAQTSANGKNTVYYQTAMPTGGTYRVGDTWFDTDDGNKVYVHNGTTFVSAQDAAIGTAQTTADSALSTANSKTKTYFQTAQPGTTGNTTGDLWFDTDDGNKPYVWNGTAWTVAQDAAIAAAQTSANGKNRIYYQTTMPAGGTYIAGDTWFDTDDGYKIYVHNGTTFTASALGSSAIADLAITDAKIANATISNAKISSLDAGKITTGTLDANRIGADTITAAHLAANSVTADELAANSITAAKGQISDAAITTAKIADAQVTTAKIANLAVTDALIANATISNGKIASLDAAKITSGTIDANRIGANTISASKLFVGDLTNLAADGNFTDLNKVNWTGSGTIVQTANEPNKLRVVTAASGNNDQPNTNSFQVTAGEQIYGEVWVYGEATNVGNGGPNMHLAVTLHDGTMSWPQFNSATRAAVSGVWVKLSGSVTIPANAKTAKVEPAVSYSADAVGNIYYFREVSVRRKATGSLIVDGAIQAGSAIIATGAIGTAQIGNLAVTDAQIANTTITNGKIANLDAAKITTGTLDANRIGADTITAAHIASDAVTANELAANSITAVKGQISDLAVTTAKIDNLAITNAKIADLAVTDAKVSNLNAGKITAGTIDVNRLNAEDIKTKLIEASLINAADILATGSITATNGLIGSLDAGVITAGTLSASRLSSKSITADKLAITSTDNLIVEADFSNNGASWETGGYRNIHATAGRGGTPALQFGSGIATEITSKNLANKFTVEDDNRFYGKIYAYSNGAVPAGNIKMLLRCYTDGSATPVVTDTLVCSNTAALAVNTWTSIGGVSAALPSGTIYAEVILSVTPSNTTFYVYLDSVALTRAGEGKLIVDGSIVTSNIATGAITATKIDSNAVTADKISGGAIDGKTITGASIRTADPALLGARVIMDSTGLRAWDAANTNYLTADATGLSLVGELMAKGQSMQTPPIPMTTTVGNLDQAGASWNTLGVHFSRDDKPISSTNYMPPSVTSSDGEGLFMTSSQNSNGAGGYYPRSHIYLNESQLDIQSDSSGGIGVINTAANNGSTRVASWSNTNGSVTIDAPYGNGSVGVHGNGQVQITSNSTTGWIELSSKNLRVNSSIRNTTNFKPVVSTGSERDGLFSPTPVNGDAVVRSDLNGITQRRIDGQWSGFSGSVAYVATQNGYNNYGNGYPTTHGYMGPDGRSYLGGMFGITSTGAVSIAAGTFYTMGTLPATCRPPTIVIFRTAAAHVLGHVLLYVFTNGTIQYTCKDAVNLTNGNSQFWISLEGASWRNTNC